LLCSARSLAILLDRFPAYPLACLFASKRAGG
jgi:hypothetical protein